MIRAVPCCMTARAGGVISVVATIGTQIVTDNFNRADGTLGANWTTGSGTGHTDLLQIASNVVIAIANNNDCDSFWNPWTSGDDQYSQAEITASTTTAGAGYGPAVRRSSTAGTETFYRLVVDASGNYELGRFNANSFTSLRTGTVSFVSGKKLGLAIQGSTLKIWYDGVQVGTDFTDSSPIASGLPGLAYSSTVTGSLDNWDAGTVP